MTLAVKLTQSPSGGYMAWCPALPGCKAQGATPEEAALQIRSAVTGYVASLDVALPESMDEFLSVSPVSSAA